ncbi:MAG: 50S ribosomal protein L29 [Chloroflexi bacterium]|jgi:large subunit ribosomal protein L29|uniref:Large ribosomal subunit protein uL29 n=1 Tax=Candidatus Thermofonsia Clade 3 bacterium TaxID=2364212 RepID=A0A2M8QD47_9CHLR|nr:50S ribosomal protein L29 [Candidatus Roseilinea sp. NK_OTU-006]PJF47736.1 MAG: 50S ribosomal protein L29 [Candidatus Thermofonsia Clade 3 bacterium]RMG61805.1 MAG: 50S ribosomal protein L29 [Chloroflexota bacterium]
MRSRELSKLPTPELEAKLDDAYRELFNLRFQRAQGQLTDTNSIKRVRHDIARIKTILRQRELAAQLIAQSTTSGNRA